MLITPNLNFEEIPVNVDYINKLLGIKFTAEDVKNLLVRMGIECNIVNENLIIAMIPPYRTDILHPMDIVEEVAIAYGYENCVPEKLNIFTIGEKDDFYKFCDEMREKMVGLNFFEILSLNLTNKETLFKKMNIEEDAENIVVETENALSLEHSVMRNYLLASLLSFLEKNKTKKYPQRVFEIGKCIVYDKNIKNFSEITKLGCVIAHNKTNFSEIKSVVGGILKKFDVKEFNEKDNKKFFIEGRGAKILVKDHNNNDIDIGFFGEIHPKVIENFNLEVPLTACEIDLNKLYECRV